MAETEMDTTADTAGKDRKAADAADSSSEGAYKAPKPDRRTGGSGKRASRRPAGSGSRPRKKAGSSGEASGTSSSGTKAKRRSGRASKGRRQPLTESFSHAFDGIMVGITERNMKIHFGAALLVLIFGLLLQISVTEWCICFVLFGLVMGLELVNTAIEAVVDLVTEEYHPLAKRAKDTAAGAVLIAAIMAAVTGLIIFIPRLLYVLRIF